MLVVEGKRRGEEGEVEGRGSGRDRGEGENRGKGGRGKSGGSGKREGMSRKILGLSSFCIVGVEDVRDIRLCSIQHLGGADYWSHSQAKL